MAIGKEAHVFPQGANRCGNLATWFNEFKLDVKGWHQEESKLILWREAAVVVNWGAEATDKKFWESSLRMTGLTLCREFQFVG